MAQAPWSHRRFWRWPLTAIAVLLVHMPGAMDCLVPSPVNPNHMLEGVDLQYKMLQYFDSKGPPPLEEVFFTTQNMTRATQDQLMRECPGLLISSFVLLAETRLPVAPLAAADAIAKADQLAARLSAHDYEATIAAWPVLPALAGYRHQLNAIEAHQASVTASGALPTVEIVVCHCRESLDWLGDGRLYIPRQDQVHVDLFIYEKCKRPAELEIIQTAPFRRIVSVDVEDGAVRRDECSGYLRHLVDHYEEPADYTLFFQADAGDHLQWSYLELVMRAIGQHSLQADFVHFNHPRLVASLSPCREEVFRRIFDRPPRQMLGSYCCAQFAVSEKRFRSNPLKTYTKMQQLLFEESPDECHDIPGHSTQCLMFEVYWHVLFGETDDLPYRDENTGLPLFLRIRDMENESYLPPGTSLYLDRILAPLEES